MQLAALHDALFSFTNINALLTILLNSLVHFHNYISVFDEVQIIIIIII